MSIKVVRDQINTFLATETPEVISIKGAWGVGKTYTWKKYLLDAKNGNEVALERYSYVSLFGINSLDALKYALFENLVNKEIIGKEASVETLKTNTTDLAKSLGRKSLKLFKGIFSQKGFSPALESPRYLATDYKRPTT